MNAIASIIEKGLIILYSFLGNYGLAIIGITILIKLVLFPLTLKQDKSMREMKKIQPEVEKLKEKLKDNPQELSKATMELYKEHKVNPMGGCLPVLVQMPILWSLFRVLRATGEQAVIPTDATFFIWKLTEMDPLYILPILNGVVAFLQQKIMSKGTTQNKQAEMMMYFFPVMILMISFKMPTGLQIYWLTSSFFSLVQQFYITKIGDEKSAK